MSLNFSFRKGQHKVVKVRTKPNSVNDLITDYVPELNESGYNRVRMKNLLMATAITFKDGHGEERWGLHGGEPLE